MSVKLIIGLILFVLGVFLFANGWQQSSIWITNVGLSSNFAGQTCSEYSCLRPEWIALGAGLVLCGLVLFFSSLRSSKNYPDNSIQDRSSSRYNFSEIIKRFRIGRKNYIMIFSIFGVSILFLFSQYGVHASGKINSYTDCSTSDPIMIEIRNNTFKELRSLILSYDLIVRGNSVYSEQFTHLFSDPVSPISTRHICINNEYTDRFINIDRINDILVVDEAEYSLIDVGSWLDEVDRVRELERTHNLEVRIVR